MQGRMTSLALAHIHPAPHFNADFYTVAATVIPVLFLAVAVQGSMYEELLKAIAIATLRAAGAAFRASQANNLRRAAAAILVQAVAAYIPLLLVAGIVVTGIAGEIQALIGLAWQRNAGQPFSVLFAAVFLTITAGAGPIWRLGRLVDWMLNLVPEAQPTVRPDSRPSRERDEGAPRAEARKPDSTADDGPPAPPEEPTPA